MIKNIFIASFILVSIIMATTALALTFTSQEAMVAHFERQKKLVQEINENFEKGKTDDGALKEAIISFLGMMAFNSNNHFDSFVEVMASMTGKRIPQERQIQVQENIIREILSTFGENEKNEFENVFTVVILLNILDTYPAYDIFPILQECMDSHNEGIKNRATKLYNKIKERPPNQPKLIETLEDMIREKLAVFEKNPITPENPFNRATHGAASENVLKFVRLLMNFNRPKALELLEKCVLLKVDDNPSDTLHYYLRMKGADSIPVLRKALAELFAKNYQNEIVFYTQLEQTLKSLQQTTNEDNMEKIYAFFLEKTTERTTMYPYAFGLLDRALCETLDGYENSLQREQARFAPGVKFDPIPKEKRIDLSKHKLVSRKELRPNILDETVQPKQ